MVVESILEMVMGILELEEEEEDKLVVGGEEEEEEYLAYFSKSLPLEFLKQKESEHKNFPPNLIFFLSYQVCLPQGEKEKILLSDPCFCSLEFVFKLTTFGSSAIVVVG
jgi:hypothetical protein